MTSLDASVRAEPGAARRRAALIGISLGYFMVLLDTTVLSVAEPDLAGSLRTSVAGLQWATTAYTVVFAALLPSAGAVADRYGAHRVFRAGVAVFGAGSLLCAVAPDLAFLVGVRAVLGAAAAACVPASMAVIGRLYPGRGAHARAVAVWAAISGSAVAAGPVVGGLLVGLAGWRAIFVVNAPIAVAVLALAAGRLVRTPRGDRRVDWLAQAAGCAVLALLTDAVIAAGGAAWPHAGASLAGAAAAAAVFAALERRSAAPVLDRAFLRGRGVRAGLLVGAAANFTLTGDLFVLPLLLHDRSYGPVGTGLAFLPLTLPFVLLPTATGRIVARSGPRAPILAGTALLALGGAALAVAARTDGGYLGLLPGLLLTGLGMPFVLPALVAAVVGAAPPGTAGATGGLLNAGRQVGATLGVAAMGAVGAAHGALWLAGGVCAAAGLWFARAIPRRTGP
ncbi:MFS transporter [Actinomadura atramentaria]|uniref:MFS transporter n=1 Tax=Actinomadura atramentaria TaxID=1990 RepID=UPI00037DD62F|nr:MFS transporter [Actinomadura atramentaria]